MTILGRGFEKCAASPLAAPWAAGAPAEVCGAKFRGEKEPQRSERAMIFYKKIVASDMLLMAALWAAGAPAKICEAKFRGEKEEQGSGRMTLF